MSIWRVRAHRVTNVQCVAYACIRASAILSSFSSSVSTRHSSSPFSFLLVLT